MSEGVSIVFEKVLAGFLSLEPGFLAVVLVTFALFMTWFKRRKLARFVPTIAGDFLTRHVDQRAKRYPYGG
jgi:hypothetical protein